MGAAADIGLGIALGIDRVLDATGGTLARAGAATFSAVVIDGRDVPAGALFFAIKGERFDGHDFVAQAVAGGARGVVVARGRAAGPIAAPAAAPCAGGAATHPGPA